MVEEALISGDVSKSEPHNPEPHRPKPTFKLVAQVIVAMKRFQAALNPTYEYGKRPASPTNLPGMPPAHKANHGGRSLSGSGSGRATSGKTLSGRPTHAGVQHGFKGNLLFKPLPPLPSEEKVEA